ncbi:MAG: SIMPL domain-containing protein [Chloroflexota bacterium]
MSQKIQSIVLVVIAIMVIALLMRPQEQQLPTVQEFQIVQANERTITVAGEGEIKVKPDRMKFVIVITTRQKELEPAKEENERIIQEVTKVLEDYGIAEDDIKMDFLRIKTDATQARVYNYIVEQDIQVTLRDLTQIEALFMDILKAGAIEIGQVSFQVSNIELFKEQTLGLALQSAKRRAIVMARELGQDIGEPLSIQESPNQSRSTNSYQGSITLTGIELDYIFDEITAAAYGEITITAFVVVEFQLK